MAFRRFVLEPAVEVAPDMPHPLTRLDSPTFVGASEYH